MKNYMIMVDACTFMTDMSKDYFSSIKDELIKTNNHIILQYKVAKEINKLLINEKKETRERAKQASSFLNSLIAEDVVKIYGSDNDNFADHQFLNIIHKFRAQRDICIITQDSSLAEDILNIKNSKSTKYNTDLRIVRLNEKGSLDEWDSIKERQALKAKKFEKVNVECYICKKIYEDNAGFLEKLKSENKKYLCGSCKKKLFGESR
ncbi:MAG: hypothetical protein ACRCWM_01635 [Sarcina sp.]